MPFVAFPGAKVFIPNFCQITQMVKCFPEFIFYATVYSVHAGGAQEAPSELSPEAFQKPP